MLPSTILNHLKNGKTVTYKICRLRGYLCGDSSLLFTPKDVMIGEINISHKLKCFRFDEKPYNNPRWIISEQD